MVVLIGSVNTRMNLAQRLKDGIVNAGDPPRVDQVPPFEEEANVD